MVKEFKSCLIKREQMFISYLTYCIVPVNYTSKYFLENTSLYKYTVYEVLVRIYLLVYLYLV